MKTKKKGLRLLQISGFLVKMRMGTTKQMKKVTQIGGVMVSHHNMVTPPPSDATVSTSDT